MLLIISVFVIILGVAIFAYFSWAVPAQKKGILPSDPPGKLNVLSFESEVITVNDVFGEQGTSKPVEVINDSATGTTSALLASTGRYDLVAFSGTDGRSFLIALTTAEVRTARMEAEAELLRRLGVEREVLCRLPIRITVMRPFDENFPQDNLGLSFCPGSEQL